MPTRSANAVRSVDEAHAVAPRPSFAPRYRVHRDERSMAICEAMIDICAALYNVCGREMRQTGRTSNGVARVRQIAMYVAHVGLGMTMQEVGCGFLRDRTTVRHACHLIEDLRDDEEFDRTIAMTERVARAAFRHSLDI